MSTILNSPLHLNSLYSPLQDDNEIRLLRLQPLLHDARIACTIDQVKFSENPGYEALSYMWGPEDRLKTIKINNMLVRVRENLWAALLHLRHENTPRTL